MILCLVFFAAGTAGACLQLATELKFKGTAFEARPIGVFGNRVRFQSGEGALELAFNRISQKWCFERVSAEGGILDSGCISTQSRGGELVLLAGGRVFRSIPLREPDGRSYAEITLSGNRMTIKPLTNDGRFTAKKIVFTDQSEGGRESVRITTRLCDTGPRCAGAAVTTSRNPLRRTPASMASRTHGPIELSDTSFDYHAGSCGAPYSVRRNIETLGISAESIEALNEE